MTTDIKSPGSIAELLRGDFKQSENGKVMLPFAVPRRLGCIHEETKPSVLKIAGNLTGGLENDARDTLLSGVVGQDIRLYSLSRFTFASLKRQGAKGRLIEKQGTWCRTLFRAFVNFKSGENVR